jgi:hypothetical protein
MTASGQILSFERGRNDSRSSSRLDGARDLNHAASTMKWERIDEPYKSGANRYFSKLWRSRRRTRERAARTRAGVD